MFEFQTVGQIPEWSKGADCKSAGSTFGGSNPPLPKSLTPMDAAQSLEDETLQNIIGGNFSRALQICDQWMDSLSVEQVTQKDIEFMKISEAYFYSRFFAHRQERLGKIPQGAERARLFINFFQEIESLHSEKKFSKDSSVYEAISFYMHKQIADGLAKAFAGQKAYSLQLEELLQLARSLVEIENWNAALETLTFIHQYNSRNPEVLLLIAFVYLRLDDVEKFQKNFREALFIKPEVLENYTQFIPTGNFSRLWDELIEQNYPFPIIFRFYALFAETNGLYASLHDFDSSLTPHEAEKTEQDFKKLYRHYQKKQTAQDTTLPRLLHILCWLLLYYQNKQKESFQEYRDIFNNLEPSLWQNFYTQVLKPLEKK